MCWKPPAPLSSAAERGRSYRSAAGAAVLLALALPAGAARGQSIELSGRLLSAGVDGDTRLGSPGLSSTRNDFEHDWGYEGRARLFDLGLRWRAGEGHVVEGRWLRLSLDGAVNARRDLTFLDTVLPRDTRVESDFEATLTRVSYRRRLGLGDERAVDLRTGLAFLQAEQRIVAPGVAERSADLSGQIPVLGLGYHTPMTLWGLPFTLHLDALAFLPAVVRRKGAGFDLAAELEYRFGRTVSVLAGYQWLDLRFDPHRGATRRQFHLRLGAVVAGLALQF